MIHLDQLVQHFGRHVAHHKRLADRHGWGAVDAQGFRSGVVAGEVGGNFGAFGVGLKQAGQVGFCDGFGPWAQKRQLDAIECNAVAAGGEFCVQALAVGTLDVGEEGHGRFVAGLWIKQCAKRFGRKRLWGVFFSDAKEDRVGSGSRRYQSGVDLSPAGQAGDWGEGQIRRAMHEALPPPGHRTETGQSKQQPASGFMVALSQALANLHRPPSYEGASDIGYAMNDRKKTVKDYIRTIVDFPHEGIMFRDVTTLFADPRGFRICIDQLLHPYAGERIDKVVGLEARGFIVGGAIAHQLSVGFVPIRKKGKLPGATLTQAYTLEYGEAVMEVHDDAIQPGEKVLVVDDLLATGGTAEAGIRLIEKMGGDIIGCAFVIDLPELGGRTKLEALGMDVHVLCEFEGA